MLRGSKWKTSSGNHALLRREWRRINNSCSEAFGDFYEAKHRHLPLNPESLHSKDGCDAIFKITKPNSEN